MAKGTPSSKLLVLSAWFLLSYFFQCSAAAPPGTVLLYCCNDDFTPALQYDMDATPLSHSTGSRLLFTKAKAMLFSSNGMASDLKGTIENQQYLEFTIRPRKPVSFDTLGLIVANTGSNAGNDSLKQSLTFWSIVDSHSNDIQTIDVFRDQGSKGALDHQELDVKLEGFQAVSSPVTFRIYMHGDSASRGLGHTITFKSIMLYQKGVSLV